MEVKGSGVAFAITKATEGETYTDPGFARNRAGMRAAGPGRAAYPYGRPGRDPAAQARPFVETADARSVVLQTGAGPGAIRRQGPRRGPGPGRAVPRGSQPPDGSTGHR